MIVRRDRVAETLELLELVGVEVLDRGPLLFDLLAKRLGFVVGAVSLTLGG